MERSVLKLTGLNKDKQYSFWFFGSRKSVSDNRETAYTVLGRSEQTVTLNTSNNTTRFACAENIRPNANGEMTIVVTADPNNTNSYRFYHLNAMKLTVTD